MPKFDLNAEVATAKTWATAHVLASAGIGVVVGILIGMILG